MAGIRRGQSRAIAIAALLSFVIFSSPPAGAQSLYDRPTLVIDPGMHTAPIRAAAVDATGRFAVTGGDDKTVRVWSVSDGKLLQTIRVPAGPYGVGTIYGVAMGPDGDPVAVGGLMLGTANRATAIYLFNWRAGQMIGLIAGPLPEVIRSLVFSTDGRYLAATLGGPSPGLRVYDRDNNWSEAFRDTDYGADSYRAAFAHDGRLATTALDGKVRLYDPSFKLVTVKKATSGDRPFGIAFSPDDKVLAVGYADAAAIDLFNAQTLAEMLGPSTDRLLGKLLEVAWSPDGQILYAGGWNNRGGSGSVFAWDHAGRYRTIFDGHDTITSVKPLARDELLVTTMEPCLATLKADGSSRWTHEGAGVQWQRGPLSVSADGEVVEFFFEQGARSPLRFDLRTLSLSSSHPDDGITQLPKQNGLLIDNWLDSFSPALNGKPIQLMPRELSRGMAISPDNSRFVIGGDFSVRAFDAKGAQLWEHLNPIAAWAVNVTGNGRVVVVAYADGTIRWHRMDDGHELLALMVLSDMRNWVAWTPEGFYAATPGAYGVLRWQVNHGVDAAATTIPVSEIPKLRRPDVLPHVLEELEIARALGVADIAAARRDVQEITGAANPPGARLHVLTIGINDYGDKAKRLRLDFASTDASDVFNALVNTQDSRFNKFGGLYAEVLPAYVHDSEATKEEVYEALASMQRNMAKSTGDDLAVVMFSGHGAVLDGQFYLLPYGVNAATASRLEATAIPVTELQGKLAELAKHGRVLVLLDACHSGAAAGDGTQIAPNANLLRSALVASNVTVLTSSNADEVSREDPRWGNGAFTKALLEALGGAADTNNDGLISMSELTDYLSARVAALTGGQQHVGLEQGFQRQLFVAGLR
jgi:WD40 repeat protein